MFTALVRAHAKEGYILGGHPEKEWLCAVLKEDGSEDVSALSSSHGISDVPI